jgi:hypothetical protein
MSGFILPSFSFPPEEKKAMSCALSASAFSTPHPSRPSFLKLSLAATEMTFFPVPGDPIRPPGPAFPAANKITIS